MRESAGLGLGQRGWISLCQGTEVEEGQGAGWGSDEFGLGHPESEAYKSLPCKVMTSALSQQPVWLRLQLSQYLHN